MPESVGQLAKRLAGWKVLQFFLCFMLFIALTGCYLGPATMHYDIQEYNKQVVSSEEEMLLYSVAALHEKQPPHFMMLSSIAQTRNFSANASFQWSHLWSILPLGLTATTAHGSNTYQTGVAAGATENPTFSFIPIQGAEFAQRFESPLTDKLVLSLEDNYKSRQRYEWLMFLFAQTLRLYHGDGNNHGDCLEGIYFNSPKDNHLDFYGSNQPNERYYDDFSRCVKAIMSDVRQPYYVQIDAAHRFSTVSPKDQPTATEVVGALQVNLKWVKADDKFVLVNSVKIPAWLDYPANFSVDPPALNQDLADALEPVWWSELRRKPPDWRHLAYKLPSKYQWYKWKPGKKGNSDTYVLLPEGDVLYHDAKTNTYYPIPRAKDIPKTEEQKRIEERTRLSYGDKIVENVWPEWYDFLYVELRRNEVGGAEAEHECADGLPSAKPNNVVCGFSELEISYRFCNAWGTWRAHPKIKWGVYVQIAVSSKLAPKLLGGLPIQRLTPGFLRNGYRCRLTIPIAKIQVSKHWQHGIHFCF